MKKILTLLGLFVVLCTTKAYAGNDNTRLFSTSENSRIEIAPYNLLADCESMTPDGEEAGIRVAREYMLSENYEEFDDPCYSFPWGCNKTRNSINGMSEEDSIRICAVTSLDEIDSEYGGDWGECIYDYTAPWRTPTYEELDYILNKRPNAAERRYNLHLNGSGFQGLMLLPDNPSERLQELINESNVLNGNDLHTVADSTSYFQEEGAVVISYENFGGDNMAEFYWTSTGYDVTGGKGEAPYLTAMALSIRNTHENGPEVVFVNMSRKNMAKVRLVRNVYKVTVVPNVAERGDTAYGYSYGDYVSIPAAPKEGYEFYHSYDHSYWDYANGNYNTRTKVGIELYEVTQDTTLTAFYRSKQQVNLRPEFYDLEGLAPFNVIENLYIQIQATDVLGMGEWDYIGDWGYTATKQNEWVDYSCYGNHEEYYDARMIYSKFGVGDVVNMRVPKTIEFEEESTFNEDLNRELAGDAVTLTFDKWEFFSGEVAEEPYVGSFTEEQLTDTVIALPIVEELANNGFLVVKPRYIETQRIRSVDIKPEDDFINIIDLISKVSSDSTSTNAIVGYEGLVSDVPSELVTNDNEGKVSKMTQEELEDVDLDDLGDNLKTLSAIAGNFIGQINASNTDINELMVKMNGSLFDKFDTSAVLQDLYFDNTAIYLNITDESGNWSRSANGDTIYVNVLANEVSGLIDGFALAGHISVRDGRSAKAREDDADLVDYVISVIGEVKEGATVNGFYFDMFTSKKTLKAVRLREVQPIKMDNSGSGGSCKMASTYSDFGVKKAIYDFRYSEVELNKSSRKFSEEEFACGAVAYWLNYSGPGYTGQYTAKWAQGAKYPVLAKSADDALYGINYKCGIFADDVITKLTHFATKGNVVTMEYTQKPTKILVDGKDITTLEGSTFGDESASFIMTVGNKSVEFVYPTTYTVSYKTAEGDVLKTAEEVSTYVGDKVNASDAQLANIKKDGVVYKYVSGNEEITIVEDPKPTDNVLNLVFAADSATTTVNFLYGEKALKDAEVVMGKIGKTLVATDAQLANIELDGVTYKYVKGNTEKTIAATTSDNVLNLEFAVLTNYTINFVLEDGTVLKEAFTEEILEGETFTASEAQLADIVADGITYKYVSGNDTKTVEATPSSNVITLVFATTTTPVRNIEADKANDGTIYDLRGVKVTNPSRGLYIQNGRLILVK